MGAYNVVFPAAHILVVRGHIYTPRAARKVKKKVLARRGRDDTINAHLGWSGVGQLTGVFHMCKFSENVAREAGFARPVVVTPERGRQVDRLREYLAHADAYRRPAEWPEYVAAAALSLVARKVAVDFGPRGVRDAGEDGREEIAAAIVCGIVTGEPIPDGTSIARWIFRACRYARLRRGYIGGLATETKRERHALETIERGPYSGASMDARQPDPARVVAAIDSLDSTGALWCTSERQRAERVRVAKARGRTEYIVHRGPVAGNV